MAKAAKTYVKVIATQEFHKLIGELFGRVYLENDLVLSTNEVMFYTKEEMEKEIEIKAGLRKTDTREAEALIQWLDEIEK